MDKVFKHPSSPRTQTFPSLPRSARQVPLYSDAEGQLQRRRALSERRLRRGRLGRGSQGAAERGCGGRAER